MQRSASPKPAALPAGHGSLPWILLVAGVLVTIAAGIGLRDPWPADEPRFALIAQEMLVTGDFWIPHRGGEFYADKPPIFIWLTAAAIAVTGSVRAGFLLPSLFAGLATFGLVVDLVRRLHGDRVAWYAGVALGANVLFVMQAKAAQIDMLLVAWTTLSTYGLLRHALLGPAPVWWLVGWAAAGLGILTKGVGFLPLLMLPAWWWLARAGAVPRLRAADFARGVGTLLAVVAAWGLPMILMATFGSDPELAAYRDNILFRQTATRYASSWHHVKPWHFYLVEVLPWAWLPMVVALPWAIPAWARRFRRRDPRVVLPLTAVVLILLFFSLSPGKRGVYMLPTVPLLVIAMAPLLPGLARRAGPNRISAVLLAVLGLAALAVGIAGLAGQPRLVAAVERFEVAPFGWMMLVAALALGLVAWLGPARGVLALVLWLPLFWVSYSLSILPQLNHTRSPADLMAGVAKRTGPAAELAMPDFDEEFLLQSRQRTVHFGRETPRPAQFARAFAWMAEAPGSRWMLIEQRWRGDLGCVALDQALDLGHQNRDLWWLIPGTAVAGCRGDPTAAPMFVAPTTVAGDGGAVSARVNP